MSDLTRDDRDIERLARFAALLVPGTAVMPPAAEVPEFKNS